LTYYAFETLPTRYKRLRVSNEKSSTTDTIYQSFIRRVTCSESVGFDIVIKCAEWKPKQGAET